MTVTATHGEKNEGEKTKNVLNVIIFSKQYTNFPKLSNRGCCVGQTPKPRLYSQQVSVIRVVTHEHKQARAVVSQNENFAQDLKRRLFLMLKGVLHWQRSRQRKKKRPRWGWDRRNHVVVAPKSIFDWWHQCSSLGFARISQTEGGG